jgi:hypothetical protein
MVNAGDLESLSYRFESCIPHSLTGSLISNGGFMTYEIGYISHEWSGWQDEEEAYYFGSFAFDDKPQSDNTVPVAMIPYTDSGDYMGSGLVGQSNYRTIRDNLEDDVAAGRVVEVYGSHGFKALYYRTDFPMSEALSDILCQLKRYPLFDDDDHSDLELTVQTEAWEDDGRKDFKRALEYCYDDDEIAENFFATVSDECLDAWWRYGCEKYNINGGSGGYEDGNSCNWYFCIDDWIDKYRSSGDNVVTGPVPS